MKPRVQWLHCLKINCLHLTIKAADHINDSRCLRWGMIKIPLIKLQD